MKKFKKEDYYNLIITDILKLEKGLYMNGEFLDVSSENQKKVLIEADKLEAKHRIIDTQKDLITLCDSKQKQVEKMILGYKATSMQIERYKDKYERAKLGEFDTDTNTIIVSKHEQYVGAIRKFVDLIEYFRSAVDDLIVTNKLDRANELIYVAQRFDENTTLKQIQELLA